VQIRPVVWRYAAASALFLAVAVALAWPASLFPGQHIVGGLEHPTVNGEVFLADTMRDSVLSGRPLRWFVTDMVSYPEGQNLGPRIAHSVNLYLELIPSLPLGPLRGVSVSAVLMLALNGLAAFALGRRVLRSDLAAGVVGLFFQLNSYTLLKLSIGSLHKIQLFWLPLFLLALLAMRDRGGWRPLVGAIVCVTLGFLGYPIYAFYGLLLAAMLVVWDVVGQRRLRMARDGILLLLGFVVLNLAYDQLIGFGLGSMASTDMSVKNLPEYVPNGALDLLHPFRTFLPEPTGLPLGVSVVAAALGVVAVVRSQGWLPRFLAAAALLFVLLAAGPYVMVEGRPVELLGVPLVLPYKLLYLLVPSVYGSGVGLFFPIRALPVAVLCLALLAGVATLRLARSLRMPTVVVAGLLAVADAGEHAVRFPELVPARTGPIELPALLETIRADADCAAILHLPPTRETDACHRYCLYSSVARKRSVNPYDREGLPIDVPGVGSTAAERQAFLDTLDRHAIRWIVIHRAYLAAGYGSVELGWLEQALGPEHTHREPGLVALRVPRGFQLPAVEGAP
jgi:hypothetical protein